MDLERRYELCVRNLEEIITPDELRQMLEVVDHPKGYVGFETSGLMHAGTGLIVGKKMLDWVEAGFDFIIFLADWHSWINNKLGGIMENIRIGGEYFKECFTALGLPEGKVRYIWASDLVNSSDYWEKVIRIMKGSTVKRIQRALPIMGRSFEAGDIEAAWMLYPAMQASDIFQMDLDVAGAGLDQRKVHMLAREIAPKLGFKTPVCLHSPLLPGLQGETVEGAFDEEASIDQSIKKKMSKSVEKGAVYVNDDPDTIREKYRLAFCPPKLIEGNPVIDHAKMVVFPHLGVLEVERSSKYGGDITIEDFAELEELYRSEELHPLDFKMAVAEAMIKILEPVREYFRHHHKNLEKMRQLQVTR
ncbi:tyrosine--tRNA ligase [Candidatus Bathyarchaeota archaeon]|nr:tyrosine--tRNA ligase [Candidatus Bathyarchaeota archaeon]